MNLVQEYMQQINMIEKKSPCFLQEMRQNPLQCESKDFHPYEMNCSN